MRKQNFLSLKKECNISFIKKSDVYLYQLPRPELLQCWIKYIRWGHSCYQWRNSLCTFFLEPVRTRERKQKRHDLKYNTKNILLTKLFKISTCFYSILIVSNQSYLIKIDCGVWNTLGIYSKTTQSVVVLLMKMRHSLTYVLPDWS